MKVYQVGGSIRDGLLGLPVQDRDWVVVGATPDDLASRGFVPVGKDFPVFLHPRTHEEYALARTERKTAQGYRGFAVHTSPGVTLEEDLARRDLTINAMARDEEGRLIDPYGGQADLQSRVLRHVTEAFAEDPVRILRLARFAARLTDFSVAPETQALMQQMVQAGEVDALVPERVWQELARGLMERQPSRMFDVLRVCGALTRLLPELQPLWVAAESRATTGAVQPGVHLMAVLDLAARLQAPLPVRFACLVQGVQSAAMPQGAMAPQDGPSAASAAWLRGLCERLRVPVDCRELAELLVREQGHVHCSQTLASAGLLHLLERCDAIRKPQRFEQLLLACECDARARPGQQDQPFPPRQRLSAALHRVRAVATAGIAAQAQAEGLVGEQVGERIRQARLAALG